MHFLNVRQLFKFGHYHRLQQALIYFRYRVSTQIWIICFGGRIASSSQKETGILIPGYYGTFGRLEMTNSSEE